MPYKPLNKATFPSSTYRISELGLPGVRHSGCSRRVLPTRITIPRAREVATVSRLRL